LDQPRFYFSKFIILTEDWGLWTCRDGDEKKIMISEITLHKFENSNLRVSRVFLNYSSL